jgi:membrane associated rhomboid family serine protease
MNSRGSFLTNIPPVTKHLLIINFLLWFATIVLKRTAGIDLQDWLGLHFWRAADFNAAQFITYMFMHDTSGIAHVFFNMFSLWMFGRIIEQVLGAKRYLFYYVSCGLGAALIQQLAWEYDLREMIAAVNAGKTIIDQAGQVITYNDFITVGASGAVFGILLAFGVLFPNMPMYIIPFPFPIKAKWMVLGYGVVELLFGVSGVMAGVAHFAHLGGMIIGFFILWYWKRSGALGGGHGYY